MMPAPYQLMVPVFTRMAKIPLLKKVFDLIFERWTHYSVYIDVFTARAPSPSRFTRLAAIFSRTRMIRTDDE